MPLLPILRRTLGAGLVAGTALATYGAWEARQYTLRHVTVPLLPADHRPLRVLHLSDIHMAPDQRAKQEWLRGLADLEPDLVIDTGDNLAHQRSVPVVLDALGGLLVPNEARYQAAPQPDPPRSRRAAAKHGEHTRAHGALRNRAGERVRVP